MKYTLSNKNYACAIYTRDEVIVEAPSEMQWAVGKQIGSVIYWAESKKLRWCVSRRICGRRCGMNIGDWTFHSMSWNRGTVWWFAQHTTPLKLEIWQPRDGSEYTVRASRDEKVITGPFPTLEGAKAAYVLLEAAR